MLFTEIDHVGIAVHDLEAAVNWYATSFRAAVSHRELVERDGIEEVLLRVADSYIQLLKPTRDDSTVARYLQKRGEGIHHIAYRVENCALALDELRVAGVALVDETPRQGSRGTTVAFIQPHFGHLVELVQVND